MIAEPANETELNAAAWECADAGVALYKAKKAKKARRETWRRYQSVSPVTAAQARSAFVAAEVRYAAAVRRHKAAIAAWVAIRPKDAP